MTATVHALDDARAPAAEPGGPTGLLRAYRVAIRAELPPAAKVVLLGILDHWSAASPQPFAKVSTIAAETQLELRTVQRALPLLEAHGLLRVKRGAGPHGTHLYDLSPLWEAAESHPGRKSPRQDVASTPAESHPAPRQDVASPPGRMPPEGNPLKGTKEGNPLKGTKEGNPLKGTKARHREAPIPSDWTPTEQHRAFAREHGLDLELERVAFLGRFDGQAVKSPNGRFSTWLAQAVKFERRDGTRAGARRGPAPVSRTFDTAGDDFAGLVSP